MKESDTNN